MRPVLLLAILLSSGPEALAQTTLYSIEGEQSGLNFGTHVENLGDVDGDGFEDLLVSAPGLLSLTPPGRVRLHSGATGALVYEVPGPAQGATYGVGLTTLGDVDDDGRGDFAVGEQQAAGAGYFGYVRVHSGVDGALLYEVPGTPTFTGFGPHLDGIGDIDGDGAGDFVAGASSDHIGSGLGSVRVFSGRTGALLHLIAATTGIGNLGRAVAGVGDVDLDGTPDFAAASTSFPGEPFQAGHVRIYSGATFAVVTDVSGPMANGRFGFSLAGAGDVDDDGRGDLFVGAPGLLGDALRGRAYVCSGGSGAILHTFVGDSFFDRLGWRVFAIGDFDGDGISELAASTAPDTYFVSEYVVVYSPTNGTRLSTIHEPYDLDSSDWPCTAVGLADLDGDGRRELAIGAPWYPANGSGSGRVRVIRDIEVESVGTGFCSGDGSAGSCPCANAAAAGEGCASSLGSGARLEAFGSRSVVEDTLFLTGTEMPNGALTILFVGDDTLGPNAAFAGDGLRCISGTLRRLSVRATNENGVVLYGPELGSTGGWSAGDRLHFQTFYRNPPGPCGAGFNTTGAVTILFTP